MYELTIKRQKCHSMIFIICVTIYWVLYVIHYCNIAAKVRKINDNPKLFHNYFSANIYLKPRKHLCT